MKSEKREARSENRDKNGVVVWSGGDRSEGRCGAPGEGYDVPILCGIGGWERCTAQQEQETEGRQMGWGIGASDGCGGVELSNWGSGLMFFCVERRSGSQRINCTLSPRPT